MSTPQILDVNGQPANKPKHPICPECGAGESKRIRTGFGAAGFEFCECGFKFGELSSKEGR